ncbi:MAG: hypothetical protein FWG88_07740 [Oscillospiraceae bacterium]|nr:hypothetical protein [Oscillospiraceae bacterium]
MRFVIYRSAVHRWVTIITIAFSVVIIFIGCRSSNNNYTTDYDHATDYSRLVGSSSFEIGLSEESSYVQGTILVSQSAIDVYNIKIVAQVSIPIGDWGGVAFFLPDGCYVKDVLCTLPEELVAGNEMINLLYTGSENDLKYSTVIEIARNRYGESSGGEGIIYIEIIIPINNNEQINELIFGIEVGAKKVGNTVYWGLEHDELIVYMENN